MLQEIMTAVHDDCHEGVQCTVHRLRRDFHFPNMCCLVQDYVRACTTCQRYKSEHLHPVGLLVPLPVPQAVWTDISLDSGHTNSGRPLQQVLPFNPFGSPVHCRIYGADLLRRHCMPPWHAIVHGV
jgi:hypothetical protein